MMKQNIRLYVYITVASVAAILVVGLACYRATKISPQPMHMDNALSIQSTAFRDNGRIPALYTCKGKDISPPLVISNVPAEAKSLVLIMDDPDAPGGTWTHWVRFNITPQDINLAAETDFPDADKGIGSSGNLEYEGPCPPSGTHEYHFRIYALDTALDLPEAGASVAEVSGAMEGHIMDEGELVGLFGK